MHGSRYAAALTVFARCHYDRRRHKRVRGRSTGRGQPSVTNVLPPKGVGGGCGEARRGGTTTMMRRNRRNREPTVGRRPSLIIGGQSVRGDTPRAFFSSLCPVHGKLIRGNAGEGRSTRSRSCVSASLPRARSLRGSD